MRAIIFAASFVVVPAAAQHQHPPQDTQLHDQFYKDLERPDVGGSCCNDRDCYPTQARWRAGQWWALRREDKTWVPVPVDKVISTRSPDGRAHLCATTTFLYCFVPPDAGT